MANKETDDKYGKGSETVSGSIIGKVGEYKTFRLIYELFMVSLVVISIGLFWIGDNEYGKLLTRIVWGIFLIDVLVRLYVSRSRLMYFVKNPFDVVSIIPLDEFMLFARFARIIDLFRMKTILGRYIRPITGLLNRLHLKRLGIFAGGSLIITSFGLVMYGMTVVDTFKFVGIHFLKFNSELLMDSVVMVSVAIFVKMLGMIVFATLLSRLIVWAELKWIAYKSRDL